MDGGAILRKYCWRCDCETPIYKRMPVAVSESPILWAERQSRKREVEGADIYSAAAWDISYSAAPGPPIFTKVPRHLGWAAPPQVLGFRTRRISLYCRPIPPRGRPAALIFMGSRP